MMEMTYLDHEQMRIPVRVPISIFNTTSCGYFCFFACFFGALTLRQPGEVEDMFFLDVQTSEKNVFSPVL